MTAVSNSTLMKTLPMIAMALGKKHNIKVVCDRAIDTAQTDGQTIYLPPIPDNEDAKILVSGYIDHESAHIRCTDFSVHMGRGIQKSLVNVIEDIRIEKILGAEYIGCRENLLALEEWFVNHDMYDVTTVTSPPAEILLNRIHHGLRVKVLDNQCTASLAQAAFAAYHKVFPQDLISTIEPLIAEAETAKDTQHVVEISAAIVEIIKAADPESYKDPEPPQGPPSSSGDQDKGDESDQGDANDDGSDAPKPDEDQSSKGEGGKSGDESESADTPEGPAGNGPGEKGDADSSGDGSDSNGSNSDSTEGGDTGADSTEGGDTGADSSKQGEEADTSSKSTSPEPESSTSDQGPSQKSAVKSLQQSCDQEVVQNSDLGDRLAQLINEMSRDAMVTGTPTVAMATAVAHTNTGEAHLKSSEVKAQTNALRQRLIGLLEASARKRMPPRSSGSRVQARALPRLSCGNPRIFQSRPHKPAVNTGVVILIDESSSMARLAGTANESALATALAFEAIPGVQLAVAGFGGKYCPVALGPVPNIAPRKGFQQRANPKEFVSRAYGSTPMTQALQWASGELAALRNVTRKIVFVITDGAPDSPLTASAAVRMMERSSIETYGLGIKYRISPELIPKSSSITDIQDLPSVVFNLLKNILIEE